MSDVNFSIGGTPAPFMSAMDQVKAKAKDSAEKVTESFGIEGVKSERALHTKLAGAFTDLTKNGTNSAEAIGGAFENMTEGLRLSMGSMVALLAVSELVKGLYAGFEAGEKMKEGVKDALSINSDATSQSVEKVAASVKKLKEDAESQNLAGMSSMTAGAEVMIQAFKEGKGISDVVREDAEQYNKLKNEAHDMEDAEGAKAIENANKVLELKLTGHDKEAEALEHQQEMQEKLDRANEEHNQKTIDALNQEISLEGKLAEQAKRKEDEEKAAKLADVNNQISDEQQGRAGTNANKLKVAHEKSMRAESAYGDSKTMGEDSIKQGEARLRWEKAITEEKNIQKEINEQNLKKFQEGNERDAEHYKKQLENQKRTLELAERKAKLGQELKEAQQEATAADVDAKLFHGEASSLAKLGLGGRVSGANFGSNASLKAAQDAAKHLADIKTEIRNLKGVIGVAG